MLRAQRYRLVASPVSPIGAPHVARAVGYAVFQIRLRRAAEEKSVVPGRPCGQRHVCWSVRAASCAACADRRRLRLLFAPRLRRRRVERGGIFAANVGGLPLWLARALQRELRMQTEPKHLSQHRRARHAAQAVADGSGASAPSLHSFCSNSMRSAVHDPPRMERLHRAARRRRRYRSGRCPAAGLARHRL